MLLFGFQLSQSLRPFSSIERAPESQLEVQAPVDLQVASQPDDNKYYVGSEGPDHPTFLPPDQSDRFNQPQGAKKLGRLKVFWVVTIITVICLALAVGGGLGAGLHKSNSSRSPHLLPLVPLSFPFFTYSLLSLSSHTSTASTGASRVPVTITQSGNTSVAITQAGNTPVTLVQVSDVHSAGNSPPQQSYPPTSIAPSIIPATSYAPPAPQRLVSPLAPSSAPSLPSTGPAPQNLSEVSNNGKGSSLCSSLSDKTCRIAYSQFNDTFLYKTRTSYILPSGVDSISNGLFVSADSGCAAVWTCDNEADLAVGMTGAEIKDAFDNMYQDGNINKCGSSYLSNGCHVTANACVDCVPSVPCGSLSAEDIANKYPCV